MTELVRQSFEEGIEKNTENLHPVTYWVSLESRFSKEPFDQNKTKLLTEMEGFDSSGISLNENNKIYKTFLKKMKKYSFVKLTGVIVGWVIFISN